MLISKHDVIALIAIGSIATISTAALLPRISDAVRVSIVVRRTQTKSLPKLTKVVVTGSSKKFGADHLVVAMLVGGAVWAIVSRN